MQDDSALPGELVYVTVADTAAQAAPVSHTQAARDVLDDTAARYTGAGALAAASTPAPATGTPPPAGTAPTGVAPAFIVFDLAGERIARPLVPEDVEDTLFSLYMMAGWAGVGACLEAIGREVFALRSIARPMAMPTRLAPAEQARRMAFAQATAAALDQLHAQVVETLIALAQAAQDKALALRDIGVELLARQAAVYGVREAQTPLSQGGAEGGSGADPGYTLGEPGVQGAVEDLVAAVAGLATAYAAVEQALAKSAQAQQASPAQGAGGGGGTQPGAGGAQGGTGSDGTPDPAQLQDASLAFQARLRDVVAQHPLAPGVFAACLPHRAADGTLQAADVRRALCEYIPQAAALLQAVPASHASDRLRVVLGEPLRDLARALHLVLDDVPEVRASLWAAREDAAAFEPLMAGPVLEAVREDLIAATGEDEDALLRTAFALAVLDSLRRAGDDRDAVLQAQAQAAQAPLRRQDKTVAALSLVGLLVPQVRAFAAVFGLATVLGHALAQLDEISRLQANLDRAALQALLAGDAASFATTLAAKPRASDVVTELLSGIAIGKAVDTVVPALGLLMQVEGDVQTLLGQDD